MRGKKNTTFTKKKKKTLSNKNEKIRGVMYLFFLKHKLNNTTAQADMVPTLYWHQKKEKRMLKSWRFLGAMRQE